MKTWFPHSLVLSLFLLAMATGTLQAGNILRFGINVSDVGNLDPHFAAASQDRAIADMVFNGLLRYEPGNAPHIEPDLALSIPEFRISRKKQIWTVLLRKGVLFHPMPGLPSHEVTTDDVIFSLEKSKDEKFSAYAGEYADMTFKKIDDHTLEIILENPISPILFFPKLTNYGGGFILSKKAMETMGYEKFKSLPIGSGPFAFQQHIKGTKLALTSHASYFRGRPKLDGVDIFFIPEIKEREAGLRAGRLDVIFGTGEKGWIEEMEKEATFRVDTHGVGEVGTLHFNTRMKPLDDPRIRRAIAYSLDRDDFLSATSLRVSGPVFSPVPAQFLPGGLPEKEADLLKLDYRQDLDKARGLLKEAGFSHGFTLDLVTSEKRVYKHYYSVLKEQLAKLGIICNITVLPHADMHKQIRNTPQALVFYGAWRPNADAYLTQFFHSSAIVVTGTRPDTNFSQYDKIDKLIEAARLEIDPAAQANLWAQAQIRILNDMAALPLMYTTQCYARKSYVNYGHPLVSTMALYPQFTEKSWLDRNN